MIIITDILLLHELSVQDYGGATGLRDESLLLSAIARPFQTFDGKELYATPIEKAAALGESIIVNHPSRMAINANSGMLAMLAYLRSNGITINADDSSMYNFIIEISKGLHSTDSIVTWLLKHC